MTHDGAARGPQPYPIALRLAGRRCTIVGGGAVAERKAWGLLDAGAVVTIIAPELAPGLQTLASVGTIEVWPQPYTPGDLRAADPFLVIAATDRREVNAAVGAEARALGVPVNVVDAPREGDFSVPALLQRGRLTVAVSTAGGSPVVAGLVRDRLSAALGDGYVALLEVVAALREEGLALGERYSPDAWRAALTPEVVALAEAGRLDEAERRVRETLEIANRQGSEDDAKDAEGRESLRAEAG